MSKVTENVVFLDRGNYTTCTVHLHGGTILSYRVKNKEMLYMMQKTAFNNFSPIRGGIKFTFPYFGRRINGPKHGFTRYVPWMLEDGPITKNDGNVEAVFSLVDSEYTKAIWNYNFKISYRLTLCMNELKIAVKLENTSKHFPFRFSIFRHSIFKVEDVTHCEIYGLSACKYVSLRNSLMSPVDPEPDMEKILIQRPYLDLFLDSPSEVEIRKIENKNLKLKITSIDSVSTETLIYNPWKGEVEEIIDSDEYLHCLGVGNGHIFSEIRLEPKDVWESLHIIEVVDEDHEKKVEELGKLLDDPWNMFKSTCHKTELHSDLGK